MSLQSVVRAVQRRALLLAGSLGRVSARQCIILPSLRQKQHYWLSTSSKNEFSLETSDGNAEPLEQVRDNDETCEMDAAADRDRILGEIRKSIHENIERILEEKPIVKEKFGRLLRRRQKERTRQSLLSFSAPLGGDPWQDKGTETSSPETSPKDVTADPWTDRIEVIDAPTTSESWPSGETAPRADWSDQPTSIAKNSEIAWGALSWGAAESEKQVTVESTHTQTETHQNQSLLDLLRQPVEDETVATPVMPVPATDDGEPSVQPSLLSLLKDDKAFGSPAAEPTSDNGNQFSSISTFATTDSLGTQPTSLMDLLNDNTAESSLQAGANDHYFSREAQWRQQEKPAGNQSSSLLDILQQPLAADESLSLEITDDHDVTLEADIEEPHVGNLLPTVGMSDFWATDESAKRDTTDKVHDDDTERLPSSAVVDEGLALLLALKDRDWLQMEKAHEDVDLDSPEEDGIVEEVVLEGGIVEEELEVETENMTRKLDGPSDDDSILESIREVLEEAAHGEMELSSMDYNALLLRVATSSLETDEAIDLMLKTYKQMSELGRSGADCAPDATTFTILMVTLDCRANAPLSAADICRQMMDSSVELSSEAFAQGMSCLERRNNIRDTERLIDSVLDDETSQHAVPMWAWMSLLKMYKHENMQQEALDLVQKCMQTNRGRDSQTVAKLVMGTISWPRRDRGGRRINRSSLLSRVLDKLESASIQEATQQEEGELFDVAGDKPWNERNISLYYPSYSVYKCLILSLASEVDNKTNSGWPIVHRAFNSMRNAVVDFWPDSSLLKIGLKVAQVIGDADLAVDLVLRVHDKQLNEADGFQSTALSSDDVVGANDSHIASPSILSEPLDTPLSGDVLGAGDDQFASPSTLSESLNALKSETLSGDADGASDSQFAPPSTLFESLNALESNLPSLWTDDVLGIDDSHTASPSSLSVSLDALESSPPSPWTDGVIGIDDGQTASPSTLSESLDALEHHLFEWGDAGSSAGAVVDETSTSIRVPLQAFTSAMRICVATGDTDSSDRLLHSLRDTRSKLPPPLKSELCTLALKGYAKAGNSDAAQALLTEMRDGGLNPT